VPVKDAGYNDVASELRYQNMTIRNVISSKEKNYEKCKVN
jgi:hypothetical protein